MLKKIFSIAAEERLAFTDVNRIQFYLSPSDIMFVTAARHKLYLYTANSENICTNYTLEELETASHNQLIRCHKSHLVNPKYIQFIDKKNQFLTLEKRADGTNESVPLGRAYRNCLTLIS
jgi:DNA-binding LytR/AlgR family response regulator